MRFKKFHGNIDSVNHEDLDNYDYNYDFADDEYRKTGSIRTLFKEIDSDYCKPIRINGGFAGRNDNYIEYTSKRDSYGNLSPKKYLKVIRPYLRDLINKHKPTAELNSNNNNNSSSSSSSSSSNSNHNSNINNSNNNSNEENDRAEWKIQLVMQNNFISVKDFRDTCNIYSASKPVEIFMGSDTENATDALI